MATEPGGRHLRLSPQQERVLRLHAHGMADKEIADRLGLSLRTVRAHMHSAMARLGARTRGEAVLTAVRAGYLALEDAEEESPRARGDRAQATGATRER